MNLYTFEPSPACRAVHLTMKALGLEPNKIELNVMGGENMNEELTSINPQHCVPTLVDDDLILWESRAICQYLANQYGEDDTLYPKDPKVRAKVDFFLNFDMGTMFQRAYAYYVPVMVGHPPDSGKEEKVKEALGWLDSFLDGQEYLVGESPTIADFCLVSTVSTIQESGIDLSEYENVTAWLERCQENIEGYAEENGEGLAKFGEYFRAKLEALEE